CCSDLHRRYAVLFFITTHEIQIRLQLAGSQGIGNVLHEARGAAIVDQLSGWQFHQLNLLARGFFDSAQHALFARRYEQDRVTFTTRATSTADAVNIGFDVVRNVVVHDMTDALYVETACGNVGSDQDVETTFAQLVDSSFTQLLRHVAVEWRCGKTAGGKFVGEVDRQRLRAYEDDHAVERF